MINSISMPFIPRSKEGLINYISAIFPDDKSIKRWTKNKLYAVFFRLKEQGK